MRAAQARRYSVAGQYEAFRSTTRYRDAACSRAVAISSTDAELGATWIGTPAATEFFDVDCFIIESSRRSRSGSGTTIGRQIVIAFGRSRCAAASVLSDRVTLHVQTFVSYSGVEIGRNNLAPVKAMTALRVHGINKI